MPCDWNGEPSLVPEVVCAALLYTGVDIVEETFEFARDKGCNANPFPPDLPALPLLLPLAFDGCGVVSGPPWKE